MNMRNLAVVVFLAAVLVALPALHVNAQTPNSPAISFSTDLKTVAISYSGKTYTIPRPTTPAATFTPAGGGRYWWVATNGNDANAGTEAAPLRTIAKGLTGLSAGDVLNIQPGTYEEAGLQEYASGTASAPIVISAAPGAMGQVKIKFSDAQIAAFNSAKSSPPDVLRIHGRYVTVNGLVLEGPLGRLNYTPFPASSGLAWQGATSPGGKATNNVAYYNYFNGIGAGSTGEYNGNVLFANGTESRDHGIYVSTSDVRVIGNIVFNNVGYGLHVFNESTTRIKNITLASNVTFDNATGGILMFGEGVVYNNTVYNSYDPADCQNYQNVSGMYYYDVIGNIDARNNVFMNACYANARFDGNQQCRNADGSNNCVNNYNVYYNDAQVGPSLQSGWATGDPPYRIRSSPDRNVYADPLFINPAIGDFRLRATSPAINAGINIGLPFSGSAPDLGAYEFGSGSSTATPTATATRTSTATATRTPTRTRTPTPSGTSSARLFLPITVR